MKKHHNRPASISLGSTGAIVSRQKRCKTYLISSEETKENPTPVLIKKHRTGDSPKVGDHVFDERTERELCRHGEKDWEDRT